jgi:hypothetical protein
MIASGLSLVMLGAVVTAEQAAVRFDRLRGVHDAHAIRAGALHHLNSNAH